MNSESNQKYKLRFNITSAIVYIIGIVLLAQLFNMQIVHGKEYKEQSNTRLTRESTIKAARGSILDSSGQKLATTVAGYGVEIYRTKIPHVFINHLVVKNRLNFNINKKSNYLSLLVSKRIKEKNLTILYYRPSKDL